MSHGPGDFIDSPGPVLRAHGQLFLGRDGDGKWPGEETNRYSSSVFWRKKIKKISALDHEFRARKPV